MHLPLPLQRIEALNNWFSLAFEEDLFQALVVQFIQLVENLIKLSLHLLCFDPDLGDIEQLLASIRFHLCLYFSIISNSVLLRSFFIAFPIFVRQFFPTLIELGVHLHH